MRYEKRRLEALAEELCVPALKKGISEYYAGKTYVVTDHVGYCVTMLEALLRPLWGMAPLLNENPKYQSLCADLRNILLEGTDEHSERYFCAFVKEEDEINFANQVITELAGYMTALLWAKETLWDPYTDAQKAQVGDWLRRWAVTALRYSWQNNHYWFPMLTIIILEKMGIDCGDIDDEMKKGFAVLDSLYLSDGWYMDGAFGRFDYYLAWSHHVYPALWTVAAKDTRFYDEKRALTYKKRTEEFISFYIHIFDADGAYAAFGRSLSYRFAATAIFPAAALLGCDVDYGMCRAILFDNIDYFLKNSLPLQGDILPPGYLYESPALVENYTSEGGSYWCSKVFLALALKEDNPFWQAEIQPYAAQKGDYLIAAPVKNVHIMLENTKNSGVTVYNNTISYYQDGKYVQTFNDMAGCYSKFAYNSKAGFGLSSSDARSVDNMIALMTEDNTMCSTRYGFRDLGVKDGVMISEHMPFANDPSSVIKTWMLPLGNGYHLRAHRVTLGGRYKVAEGGFSVGCFDDNNTRVQDERGYCLISGRGQTSRICTVSDTAFTYDCKRHHPGMHILAPQSMYPAFVTEPLEKGTYYFASVFGFMTEEMKEMPELRLENNMLSVRYGDIARTIELA